MITYLHFVIKAVIVPILPVSWIVRHVTHYALMLAILTVCTERTIRQLLLTVLNSAAVWDI